MKNDDQALIAIKENNAHSEYYGSMAIKCLVPVKNSMSSLEVNYFLHILMILHAQPYIQIMLCHKLRYTLLCWAALKWKNNIWSAQSQYNFPNEYKHRFGNEMI